MSMDGVGTKTITAFAYGSNMLTARLRERCPSARPLGVAELRGYELRWHKRSRKDGSSKCDVIQSTSAGASVFGVLYEIAVSEKADLDRAEGLRSGYDEAEVKLHTAGGEIAAVAYVATDIDPDLKPYSWYHAFVLAGAREHRLPETYVNILQSVVATQDPDRTRHDRNMLLTGSEARQ
ncbi:gamma-glutamylcyclotransferase [Mesorhizobium sp. M1328]|uniref:gamma-glutamylcyclotransferase family protein n=1 Tax=Mesorhizobium sp. M1328 TaxID=2957082 RepID=UPI00333D7319